MNAIKIFLILLFTMILLCPEIHGKPIDLATRNRSCEKTRHEKNTNSNDQNPTFDYHTRNEVVVLYFKKETLNATKVIKGFMQELEPDFADEPVSFFYFDIDSVPDIVEFYEVPGIPYLAFYKHGELKESSRIKLKEGIRKTILEMLGKPVPVPGSPILENYVLTKNYQYMTGCQYLESVQYFDGLGRDLLAIARGITPGKQDLVTLTEYDNLGRKTRIWLPGLLTKNQSSICLDSLKKSMTTSELYGRDANPYTETRYELASMERVSKIYSPGEEWYNHDKAIVTEYYLNNTSLPCPFYHLTFTETSYVINKTGNCVQNELYMTKTVDEDGNTSCEFVNKMGQIVMTRQINGKKNHDTYYIYDDYGNLCVVLPPKAVAQFQVNGSWDETNPHVNELCYLYKYDSRNRCIAKKLPGIDWILNIYDCMDRIVMTQDGNLRKDKKWYYTVYDGLDRIIRNSIVMNASNLSRDSIQSLYSKWYDDIYPLKENAQDINKPLQGNIFTVSAKLQEFNYESYENLPPGGELVFKPVHDVVTSFDTRTQGLKTREKLYVIDNMFESTTPNYVEKAYYYDDKARVVQIVTRNKYNKISRESYKYDFIGNLLARHELHEIASGRKDSLLVTFEYDHASRVISSTARLNNGIQARMEYTYNDLGQVSAKKLGSGQNAIHEVARYNTRGWLEELTNEFFTSQLRYNNPVLAGTRASYSGIISEWEWQHKQKTGQNYQANTYSFSYDSLYRLNETKQYISGVLNNQHVEKGIRYDENGNILTMQRTAGGTLVDNLSYTYTGNRLTSLTENVRTSPTGDIYLPGSSPSGTYAYDQNGNMISDSRRSLKLVYNFLNLLGEVKTTSGMVKAKYTYLADGTKLGVRDNNEMNGFDYLGSLIYKKSSAGIQLETANFDNGVIRAVGSNNAQEINYYLIDHLGSVRVIVDGNGVVKERNDYYPFGAKHARSDFPQSTSNRYKYNGKEKQETGDLDYLDYGARMYDSGLGKWFCIDPKSEDYYSQSCYLYCNGNPVRFIDPNGEDGWDIIKGALLAIFDNMKPGESITLINSTGYKDLADFEAGLTIGDYLSVILGGAEIIYGAWNIVKGSAAAGVGVLAEAPTLGASTALVAGGGAAIAIGAASTTEGFIMMNSGINNLKKKRDVNSAESKYNDVNPHRKVKKHKEDVHEQGERRKQKDQGKEKADSRRKRYK